MLKKKMFLLKKGFTLVEVILALAMTALVLTATAQIFTLASKIDRTQDSWDESSRIAHYVLRQVSGDLRRVWGITARYGYRFMSGSYWASRWYVYHGRFDPEIYYLALVKESTSLETVSYQYLSNSKRLYRYDQSTGTKLIARGVKDFVIRPHVTAIGNSYTSYYVSITIQREPSGPEAKIDTVVASHQIPSFYCL